MKKTFLVLSLSIAMFFVGNLLSNFVVKANGDPPCECRYPQTNEYGVLEKTPKDPNHPNTCKKASCWVLLENE
jgi:hypothetical protein